MTIEMANQREWDRWIARRDMRARRAVLEHVTALRNLTSTRALRMPRYRRLMTDMFELRVAELRIYFQITPTAVRILTSGSKDTQPRDIERARRRRT